MQSTDVVVGVDGSPASLAALRWAADEAARRGGALRILTAYRWTWPETLAAPTGAAEQAAREQAEQVAARAAAAARAADPNLPVSCAAVPGGAAEVLLPGAICGALLVVGSRGHGELTAALLGSVGNQVATHATGPVAVVRGRTDTATGPVVVGMDGTPAADSILATAFDLAAARRCALTAVRAFTAPVGPWSVELPPFPYDREARRTELDQGLRQQVTRWAEKYPEVPVEVMVRSGETANILVAASRQAQLMVLGSRSHGGFAGLLLGSVSAHLIHHADCPVLIARPSAPTS